MARDVFNILVATHSHSTAGGYTTESFVAGTQQHRLLLVWHDILFNASSRNHYTLIILPLLSCMLPHYQPLGRLLLVWKGVRECYVQGVGQRCTHDSETDTDGIAQRYHGLENQC